MSQEGNVTPTGTAGKNAFFHFWRGWLERAFIFSAFVLLPAVVYWYISFAEATTQMEFEKDRFRQELFRQAQKVPDNASPEKTLAFFVRVAIKQYQQRGKEGLGRYLTRLEKRYPQTFFWAFWGSDGRLISGDFPQYLPGEKAWQTIMDLALFKLRNPTIAIDDLPEVDSVNSVVQRGLGAVNTFRRFIEMRGTVGPAKCLGRIGTIFWDLVEPTWEKIPRGLKEFGGIGLIFAAKGALPEEFGLPELVQVGGSPGRERDHPLIAFSTHGAGKIWVDKRLQRYPQLGEQFREKFLRDPAECLEFGSWMGVNVSFSRSGFPFRCLVIGDMREVERAGEVRKHLAAQGSLAWVFFGSILFLLQGRGITFLDSLRVRLTGAFMLAMLLPILALGWTGSSYLAAEKERLFRGIKDQARERIRQIDVRYQGFQLQQERHWQERMAGLVSKNQTSLEAIQRGLQDMADEGVFTHFYLSDPEGKVAATNNLVEDDSDRRNIQAISLMLKMILTDRRVTEANNRLEKENSQDLLQEEVRETLVDSLGKDADPQKFLRTGRLFSANMGNLRGFSMSIFFTYEDKLRLIWVWASLACLEKAFVKTEIERWKAEDPKSGQFPFRVVFPCRPEPQSTFPPDLKMLGDLGEHLAGLKAPKTSIEETGTGALAGYYYLFTPVSFLDFYSIAAIERLDGVNERITLGQTRLWGAMALITLLAIMLGIILSGGLIRPIGTLDTAFGEVRDGNLSITLPEMGRDEIGRLGATFNTMVAQLRERERMRAYVSGSVLEKVRDEHASGSQEAQYRPAGILFSDIRGFTTLSEKHPPAQIFDMLNGFLGGVEGIIRAHAGDVDKFIGDAVMAVFLGEERAIARSAVQAALDMRLFLEHFNRERMTAGLFPIEIGIGINTGHVLWGDIGSTRRKDSTVIGDEVNLASRLETASKMGRHTHIVISESTYVQVKELVEVEEMSVREVKGKEQMVRMYEIIALKPVT